jgi:hypothetical protein
MKGKKQQATSSTYYVVSENDQKQSNCWQKIKQEAVKRLV